MKLAKFPIFLFLLIISTGSSTYSREPKLKCDLGSQLLILTVPQLNEAVSRAYGIGDLTSAACIAERLLRKQSALLPRTHPDNLTAINNLGVIYHKLGRYSDAILYLEEAYKLRASELEVGHRDTRESAFFLRDVYLDSGNYQKAEELLKNRVRGFEQFIHSDPELYIEALLDLANLQDQFEELDVALRSYENALSVALRTQGAHSAYSLQISSDIGELLLYLSRYAEAEPHIKKVSSATELVDSSSIASLQLKNNLAAVFAGQGKIAEAIVVVDEIIDTSTKHFDDNSEETLRAKNFKAVLYHSKGETALAAQTAEEVWRARKESLGESHPNTLGSGLNLSTYLRELGEETRALDLLHEIIEITEGREDLKDSEISAKLNVSLLLAARGEFEKASMGVDTVYAFYMERFGAEHISVLRTGNTLASIEIANGNYIRALELILFNTMKYRSRIFREQQNSSSAQQRVLARRDIESIKSLSLSFAALQHSEGVNAGDLAANAMLRLKGLGGEYDAALRQVASEQGGESVELVARLQMLWPQLEALERAGDVRGARAVQDAIGETELALARLSPDFSGLLETPNWEDVSDALPDGSVLLEYMTYAPRDFKTGDTDQEILVGAVLMRAGHEPVFEPLGSLQTLEDDIRLLTSLDSLGIRTQAIRDSSRAIYRRLVEPFDELIQNANAVYVSPDDVLFRVPFELLRTPRRTAWGLERSLHLLPTGRALKAKPSGENDGRFVAIGGADYGDAEPTVGRGGSFQLSGAVMIAAVGQMRGEFWGELKGALAEVEQLSKLFESSGTFKGKVAAPLTGAAATEAAMRSVAGPPAILHLATHGGATDLDFASNPLSRVVLGFANVNSAGLAESGPTENDGLMRGTDIAQLDLHGTQLVTLSACDTGDGVRLRGEGVLSLAFAFRLAGAQNVLMTYWPVDDEATQRFMVDFYTTWLDQLADNPNTAPNQALRATKQSWATRGEHPRHWAAFALIENAVNIN